MEVALSLLFAFGVGFFTHWCMSSKQRKLLKKYTYYKAALAKIDEAIMRTNNRR